MFSFRLTDDFIEPYKAKPVKFGYPDAAGNSIGELTMLRTYSRVKEDGTKERWWELCRRVIEGTFSIQKDWCRDHRLPWNDQKAHASAKEAYDLMFNLKWSPPGRGLWAMGTPMVMEGNSSPLQNCAAISTEEMARRNPGFPFAWCMSASMLGIGVGFDTKGADKEFVIQAPGAAQQCLIPDTREGWADSARLLINSYLVSNQPTYEFDYSEIRVAGEPIKTFGGIAAGPEPLIEFHDRVRSLFNGRKGQSLTTLDIVDLMNMVGVCVVSGNVRRSALLALGALSDKNFVNSKDYEQFPYRTGWGWMSNNTVDVQTGDDLSGVVEGIRLNGEPGVSWRDVTQNYGRLIDPPDYRDHRAVLWNPCSEQPLESGEMCTLADVYISNCESEEEFKRAIKVSYMYAKTVTLIPTDWENTNSIMQRNRRIGLSLSGTTDFADKHGVPTLKRWMDDGYKAVREWDNTYSEWLCVRESIRVTTSKPGGTTSLVAGTSAGCHWGPGGKFFLRGIVFAKSDPLVALFRASNYETHQSVYSSDSVFVQFPVRSAASRSEREVSIFEKANMAALAQRYWSDNGVSCTVSFDPETEGHHVGTILSTYEGQYKSLSFLPMGNHGYKQAPYQSLTEEEYVSYTMKLLPLDWDAAYGDALDGVGERGCTTDKCLLPSE